MTKNNSEPKNAPHGQGGELHQQAAGSENVLTTNHGVPISDNQNSLRSGARGPTLLEDFTGWNASQIFDAVAKPLLNKAGVEPDEGVTSLDEAFIAAAKRRFYARESSLRMLA